MSVDKFLGVLVIFIFLWTFARGDTEVSCVLTESCILPCSFPSGADTIIHWIQLSAGDLKVHSFYYNQDQTTLQDQRFRGRTSLFREQISRGNASLQLTGVEVQDQGRYKCYTSTSGGANSESYVQLKVKVPVNKVNIEQVGNRITCSSEGIYPQPELTWSTTPPSNRTFENKTEVQQTEQQLYSISSSLICSDSDVDLICTVSTRTNMRRATLFKPISISGSHTETTISCTDSNTKPLTSLIWRFNHTQTILNQTRSDGSYTASEQWRQQVKAVSESGSLTLQDLSSNHQGTYTCELSNTEETLIRNTFLRMDKGPEPPTNDGAIIGGVVGAAAAVAAVTVLVLCCKKKKGRQESSY